MSKWNGIANINHEDYKIYACWFAIKQRCYNSNCSAYKYYGGRSITMYDEWLNDFMSFYNWAKDNGFKDGLQLDRVNNDGNYEPSNCQFITQSENKAVGKKRKLKSNTSGFVGVNFTKANNKWRARITINNKKIYLGYFSTKEQAVEARTNAEIEYFGKQVTNFKQEK